MIWKRTFDPRSLGNLVLWLDDRQASGAWTARVGQNATQPATNNQPKLATIGSRPALSFDGINDSLSLPVIALAAWHAFAVVNPSVSAAKTVLKIFASGTQAFTLQSSSTGLQVVSASGSPTQVTESFPVDSTIGAGRDGGVVKDFYSGLIGEVLVYSSALSETQATAVARYLTAKWGV